MTKNTMLDAGAQALSEMVLRAGEIVRGHIVDDALADLRVKVVALRADMSHDNGAVAMADAVLALIDGSIDGSP